MLLPAGIRHDASDIHLKAGAPPERRYRSRSARSCHSSISTPPGPRLKS
jgi:Tfp pilus assembly pilus retraction ATPase PilT